MMETQLRSLTQEEVGKVSGGHLEGGLLLTLIELPHLIMGLREFTNYAGDLWYRGRNGIDPEDYFSQWIFGKSS